MDKRSADMDYQRKIHAFVAKLQELQREFGMHMNSSDMVVNTPTGQIVADYDSNYEMIVSFNLDNIREITGNQNG